MKRILCLWIPCWPIQRILAAKPELNHRGVVLSLQKPGRGEHVVACNRQAERLGIHPGMPLSEAKSLGGNRRNKIHVEFHDPFADDLALGELAVRCEQFSPQVGIEESIAPESLLLDITGVQHLFHGEESLARKIVQDFSSWNYQICVAIADTVGAAWAMAHFLITKETPVVFSHGQTGILFDIPVEGLRRAREVPGDQSRDRQICRCDDWQRRGFSALSGY